MTNPRYPNKTKVPPLNGIKHRRSSPQFHLLRIQKTGGTSFGEKVMPKFCGGESRWCQYLLHSEWQGATNHSHFNGSLVTFLRHPVERTMSEFFFLRSFDGQWCATQPQWDFQGAGQWLKAVQTDPSVERALLTFLEGYKGTPVRNRQSLYLIGFDRKTVRQPGALYNWVAYHPVLLEIAKDHLRKTIFGITDCFNTSLQVITEKLGWNTTEALQITGQTSFRKTDTRTHKSKTFFLNNSRVTEFLDQTMVKTKSQAWRHTAPWGTWRQMMPPALVNYIENWNAVDMELYEYAMKLFQERYNRTCVETSPAASEHHV